MRAVRIHEHGGPAVLRVEEVADPTPGPDDLLVRMHATSVNHRDCFIRAGDPHPAYHVELPAMLGLDVSGEVVGMGNRVEGFTIGERITANSYVPCGRCKYCRRGQLQDCSRFSVIEKTYAELVVVPACNAVKLSARVSYVDAACFPGTYTAAWQMLMGKAQLTANDVVFVWAGTSGLGSAAIEIAKLAGATVIATAGQERKLQVLRDRGPDLVLDHHKPGIVESVRQFTDGEGASVVLEHIGKATWKRSMELAASGARIVCSGATSGDNVQMDVTDVYVKQLRILGSRLGTMDDIFAAAKYLNAGRFKPLVGATLPLEEAAEAHRLLETGQVIGKIVLTMG